MRWFTGTPCNFIGGEAFFCRESGLTSRGFEALGIESGAIILGPARPEQLTTITRGTWEQLQNQEWWASLQLDGLVFYTWGNPKYQAMVKAAMGAGIRVAQVTDTQGIMSPVSDLAAHIQAEHAHYWHEPTWKRILRTLAKLPFTLTARVAFRDLRYAQMISCSDFFFAATPRAAERYEKFVRRLRGSEAAKRVRFVPIPVNFHFNYSTDYPKLEEVVAVGRWDNLQKRTPLLMGTISQALRHRPSIKFRIFGQTTQELKAWHLQLPSNLRDQVVLEGIVPNSELAVAYQRARIMLVSAAYEGCHNSSAEAVCSGATIVAVRSPFLGALEWHAGKKSGRLAERATPESLAQTLLDEMATWDQGERDPVAICEAWTRELHPDRVATKILNIFGETLPHKPL